MTVREKRDPKPVLLNFGIFFALSLGGILYSILSTKRAKPPQSPPPPSPSGCSNQVDSGGGKSVIKNDNHELQTTSSSSNTASITPEKRANSSVNGISPCNRCSGDTDGFLLSELDGLVKEFDLPAHKAILFPQKDVETTHSNIETPSEFICVEREDYEQEIKNLIYTVQTLRERERTAEIQLLEYYGLKEQETAIMELQNRLKIHNMEAKLFNLKFESLQGDNRRLEAKVADYAKVVAELEAAKANLKQLKKKLKSETEHNKEQILTLQERLKKLQDQEHEAVASDPDIQMKLQRLMDLEVEAQELKESKYSLQLENSDLAQKLAHAQLFATSVPKDEEEEIHRLRQQNEDLLKEIEQIQVDRCADVEELVYLRWINACLRYELRNYQPGPGKTIASDLCKSLSPKSEEKAKQLIIEYAKEEGFAEKDIHIADSDFDRWSYFHSHLTDSGGFNDSPGFNLRSSALGSSRSSLDVEKLSLKVEVKDLGSSSRNSDGRAPSGVYKTVVFGRGGGSDSQRENQLDENPARVLQKSELVKYAEVLKDSSGEMSRFHSRLASRSSF
ncbi:hypothetical protein U1Q18_026919 [Sarracenia purpurea var. burkii]